MHYECEAFALSKKLLICIYRPDADLHFPLSADNEGIWRLTAWSIVKSMDSDGLVYVVILSLKDDEHEGGHWHNSVVSLQSQFGRFELGVSSCLGCEDLDTRLKQVVCVSLLKVLVYETAHDASGILLTIRDNVEQERARSPYLIAHEVSRRTGILIGGLHVAKYIVSLDDALMQVAEVEAVSFDSVNGGSTFLQTGSAVKPGNIMLLSDAEYKFATLA